jgi:hypothetical protein
MHCQINHPCIVLTFNNLNKTWRLNMRMMQAVLGLGAVLTAASSHGAIVINEVLGSTTSSDTEFIELYNTSGAAVDISGWSFEFYDSDAGSPFGGLDGGSPYVIDAGTTIGANDYFLMGNSTFESIFSITSDQTESLAIENSSYTMVLKDSFDNVIETIFVSDGGAGDTANIAGVNITADFTIGPDGTFLPAGFYRDGDGSSSFELLEFSPRPAPSATPGAANLGTTVVPVPAAAWLFGTALLGLGVIRRKN